LRDKHTWITWLFEAKKSYGLSVLNYMVTSNHVHLIVSDNGHRETIPRSIQLVARRVGQDYNQRKKCKAVFWEEHYHAPAVKSGEHLVQCLIYSDLTMVCAGVVEHSSEGPFCGYHETQNPRLRYSLIDYQRLIPLLHMKDREDLQASCKNRADEAIVAIDQSRDSTCKESIAVGNERFIEATKRLLGVKGKGRKIIGSEKSYELREPTASYGGNFTPENGHISLQNTYFWADYH